MPTKAELAATIKKFFSIVTRDNRLASSRMKLKGERDWLVALRFYLAAKYRDVHSEVEVGSGPHQRGRRVDFAVSGIPIELVVRRKATRRTPSSQNLVASANKSEREKLLVGAKSGMLVLIDLSDHAPMSGERLDEYKVHPNLGPGRKNRKAFVVYYMYRKPKVGIVLHKRHIRAKSTI